MLRKQVVFIKYQLGSLKKVKLRLLNTVENTGCVHSFSRHQFLLMLVTQIFWENGMSGVVTNNSFVLKLVSTKYQNNTAIYFQKYHHT